MLSRKTTQVDCFLPPLQLPNRFLINSIPISFYHIWLKLQFTFNHIFNVLLY